MTDEHELEAADETYSSSSGLGHRSPMATPSDPKTFSRISGTLKRLESSLSYHISSFSSPLARQPTSPSTSTSAGTSYIELLMPVDNSPFLPVSVPTDGGRDPLSQTPHSTHHSPPTSFRLSLLCESQQLKERTKNLTQPTPLPDQPPIPFEASLPLPLISLSRPHSPPFPALESPPLSEVHSPMLPPPRSPPFPEAPSPILSHCHSPRSPPPPFPQCHPPLAPASPSSQPRLPRFIGPVIPESPLPFTSLPSGEFLDGWRNSDHLYRYNIIAEKQLNLPSSETDKFVLGLSNREGGGGGVTAPNERKSGGTQGTNGSKSRSGRKMSGEGGGGLVTRGGASGGDGGEGEGEGWERGSGSEKSEKNNDDEENEDEIDDLDEESELDEEGSLQEVSHHILPPLTMSELSEVNKLTESTGEVSEKWSDVWRRLEVSNFDGVGEGVSEEREMTLQEIISYRSHRGGRSRVRRPTGTRHDRLLIQDASESESRGSRRPGKGMCRAGRKLGVGRGGSSEWSMAALSELSGVSGMSGMSEVSEREGFDKWGSASDWHTKLVQRWGPKLEETLRTLLFIVPVGDDFTSQMRYNLANSGLDIFSLYRYHCHNARHLQQPEEGDSSIEELQETREIDDRCGISDACGPDGVSERSDKSQTTELRGLRRLKKCLSTLWAKLINAYRYRKIVGNWASFMLRAIRIVQILLEAILCRKYGYRYAMKFCFKLELLKLVVRLTVMCADRRRMFVESSLVGFPHPPLHRLTGRSLHGNSHLRQSSRDHLTQELSPLSPQSSAALPHSEPPSPENHFPHRSGDSATESPPPGLSTGTNQTDRWMSVLKQGRTDWRRILGEGLYLLRPVLHTFTLSLEDAPTIRAWIVAVALDAISNTLHTEQQRQYEDHLHLTHLSHHTGSDTFHHKQNFRLSSHSVRGGRHHHYRRHYRHLITSPHSRHTDTPTSSHHVSTPPEREVPVPSEGSGESPGLTAINGAQHSEGGYRHGDNCYRYEYRDGVEVSSPIRQRLNELCESQMGYNEEEESELENRRRDVLLALLRDPIFSFAFKRPISSLNEVIARVPVLNWFK
eukprot:GHVN01033197.1.p1 GENE.GHVN01033197.1~~GHVN01033197.1.p1  ORF type:complete len:1072 (+),score=236.85 GHVN01033197.1:176-3391(+)